MVAGRIRLATRELTTLSLCAALLFAQKFALQSIPNIHLGALLIIVFTLTFKWKVLYIIYTYVLLEGIVFGFDLWWFVPYLYVWTILAGLAWLFRRMDSPLGWAVLAAAHGLCFGAMTAVPWLVTNGLVYAVGWWIAGISYDLLHCAGNFAVTLILWKPMMRLLRRITA